MALGVLGDAETATVRDHLTDCLSCNAELNEMNRVARLLPLAAEELLPSPSVKDGLLERISREPRPLQARPAPRLFRRTFFAGLAAGIALLVVAGALGYAVHTHDDSALRSENARQN